MDYDTWKKYNESTSLEDCPGEEWREIEKYAGFYVSNYGRVKSAYARTRGGIMDKPWIVNQLTHEAGYKIIGIWDARQKRTRIYRVHRLIASAFIPNPENKPQIDHINTNRIDNRIENIRWVTPKENSRNTITLEHGSIMDTHYNRSEFNVLHHDENDKLIEKFRSIDEAAKTIGVTRDTISDWCNHRRIPKNKHIWHFASKSKLVARKVLHYNEKGKLIEVFLSQREAAKAVGVRDSTIANWCKGAFRPRNKHIWKFGEIVIHENGRDKSKPVLRYGIDGKFICKYKSCEEAAFYAGVTASTMGKWCNGKATPRDKSIWKYE